MLVRDSGFQLYKCIVEAPSKEERKKKEEEAKKAKEAAEKAEKEAKEAADKAAKEEEEEETKKEEEMTEEDKEKSKSARETRTKDRKEREDRDRKHREEKKKMVTVNYDLLMAASYFDLNHTGYLEAKDVEDILCTLNLSLSRAQAKKLASKVGSGSKDVFNYRNYTDRTEEEAAALKLVLADKKCSPQELAQQELWRVEQAIQRVQNAEGQYPANEAELALALAEGHAKGGVQGPGSVVDPAAALAARVALQGALVGTRHAFDAARAQRLIEREMARARDYAAAGNHSQVVTTTPPWRDRLGGIAAGDVANDAFIRAWKARKWCSRTKATRRSA